MEFWGLGGFYSQHYGMVGSIPRVPYLGNLPFLALCFVCLCAGRAVQVVE